MSNRRQHRVRPKHTSRAFTLVELMIVLVILSILAGVVLPAFFDSSKGARLSQLTYNLKSIRNAVDLYALEHRGRPPSIKADGSIDDNSNRFVRRLSDRTYKSGGVDYAGPMGPYVIPWPSNPYCDDSTNDSMVQIDALLPGAGPRGWHYNTDTNRFSANTPAHVGY